MFSRRVLIIVFLLNVFSLRAQNSAIQDSVITLYYRLTNLHDSIKLDSLHLFANKLKGLRFYPEGVGTLLDKGSVRDYYLYQVKELNRNKIDKYLDIVSIKRSQNVFEPIIDEIFIDDFVSLKKVKPLRRFRKVIHGGSWDENLDDIGFFRENGLKDTATLLIWTGLKYFDYENHRKAKHYFEQAIEAATHHADHKALCVASSYLSALYYEESEYLQALPFANKALQLSKNLGDTAREAAMYNNIGEVLYKMKRFKESSLMFDQALNAYQKIPGKKREPMQWVKLGKSKLALKEYAHAQNCFITAIDKGNMIREQKAVRDAFYYRSIAFRSQGNLEKSMDSYRTFVILKDSLFAEELDVFVRDRENYWQSLIGREITKKEYQGIVNKMNTIELDRTKTFVIILLSMSAVLLLIITLGYKAYTSNRRANQYMQDLNQTRNKFFSIVSHDLRGPLTGFIQLLTPLQKHFDLLSKEQILEHTHEMNLLAGKTLFLLDNLLKWANLQRGFIKPVFEKFSLDEIINFNIDLYGNIAKTKNLNLSYSSSKELFVLADRNMVDAIIRNLLNNAVKFTPEGGFIKLSGHIVGDYVQVVVADNGIGIASSDISSIFDFEKCAIRETNVSEKGSGLGLLLVREFVEMNNGKIWAESPGLGLGSTFKFTLRAG